MPTERISFRGGLTCICVVTSLPFVEADMKKKGLIKNSVDFFQLGYNKGGVRASAGTHDRGGVADVAQFSDACLAVWRAWGWETQHRTRAQGFDPHGHAVLKGCPHVSSGARYQASEWEAGRDGLLRKGPITGPGPKGRATPTWQNAVKTRPKPPTLKKDDLDMATWMRYATDKLQNVGDKDWSYIKINDKGDVSFASGPVKVISGALSLRVTGLKPGIGLQVRVVQDDVNGKVTKRVYNGPVTEIVGTAGDSFRTIPVSVNVGKPPKGTRRVRLVALAPVAGVKLSRAEISYWKA